MEKGGEKEERGEKGKKPRGKGEKGGKAGRKGRGWGARAEKGWAVSLLLRMLGEAPKGEGGCGLTAPPGPKP